MAMATATMTSAAAKASHLLNHAGFCRVVVGRPEGAVAWEGDASMRALARAMKAGSRV
jgi:hypothetical protein